MQLVFLAFEPAEEAFHSGKVLSTIALDDGVVLCGGEIAVGNIQRYTFGFSETAHVDNKLAIARLRPGFDGAVVERFAFIGDHPVNIEVDGVAESLAARARAIRVVK